MRPFRHYYPTDVLGSEIEIIRAFQSSEKPPPKNDFSDNSAQLRLTAQIVRKIAQQYGMNYFLNLEEIMNKALLRKKFTVLKTSSIESRNTNEKERVIRASYCPSNIDPITTKGALSIFTLGNIRISEDLAYVEEDIYRTLDKSKEVIGIARTKLTALYKKGLNNEVWKREVLNEFFNKKIPEEFAFPNDYEI